MIFFLTVPGNDGGRKKRTIYGPWTSNGLACLASCCYSICACKVQIVEYISGTSNTCYYYYTTGGCASPYANNAYLTRTYPYYCN